MNNRHIVFASISWILVSLMLIVSTYHISDAVPAGGGGAHKACFLSGHGAPSSYGPFESLCCTKSGDNPPTYSNCEKCDDSKPTGSQCTPTTDTPTKTIVKSPIIGTPIGKLPVAKLPTSSPPNPNALPPPPSISSLKQK